MVVKLNDESYIVVNSDGKLYQAWRSDVNDLAFLTVLHLEAETPKYSYWNWEMQADYTLTLRLVNHKLVSNDLADSGSVRKLLTNNLQNPALTGETILMARIPESK